MALGTDTVIQCYLPSRKEDTKVKRHAMDWAMKPRLMGENVCMSSSLCPGMAHPPLEVDQQRQMGPCSYLSWPPSGNPDSTTPLGGHSLPWNYAPGLWFTQVVMVSTPQAPPPAEVGSWPCEAKAQTPELSWAAAHGATS